MVLGVRTAGPQALSGPGCQVQGEGGWWAGGMVLGGGAFGRSFSLPAFCVLLSLSLPDPPPLPHPGAAWAASSRQVEVEGGGCHSSPSLLPPAPWLLYHPSPPLLPALHGPVSLSLPSPCLPSSPRAQLRPPARGARGPGPCPGSGGEGSCGVKSASGAPDQAPAEAAEASVKGWHSLLCPGPS